jgi:hypothetical protein
VSERGHLGQGCLGKKRASDGARRVFNSAQFPTRNFGSTFHPCPLEPPQRPRQLADRHKAPSRAGGRAWHGAESIISRPAQHPTVAIVTRAEAPATSRKTICVALRQSIPSSCTPSPALLSNLETSSVLHRGASRRLAQAQGPLPGCQSLRLSNRTWHA